LATIGYKYALTTITFDHLLTYLSHNVEEHYKQLLAQYPFISYITYGGNDYIGIIQNSDEIITTIYDFGALKDAELKKVFLDLGETWWWESNRLIPINVFLKTDWVLFRTCLRTMNSKDVEIKVGPYVSLKEMSTKRSKRKSITLVRKVS
jgi:hypothetical protein